MDSDTHSLSPTSFSVSFFSLLLFHRLAHTSTTRARERAHTHIHTHARARTHTQPVQTIGDGDDIIRDALWRDFYISFLFDWAQNALALDFVRVLD